ncbi:MAG: peptidase C60 family protein [Candidatus Peregrinibacteria bacterium GW2011_GWC2_39_14]|nr:MAG: Peptidase C60 family protein [Candidatus Peregrinibacteria bacterium GW2011_GWA2_38_36]KKR04736.1 MAG: peptidase C60 family protein [Candidatus Peregrinibacteria bacterium GW2011_GWC2_39_14]
MQLKFLSRRKFLIVVLAVLMIFAAPIFYYVYKNIVAIPKRAQAQEQASLKPLLRLKIPRINVYSDVEEVGLNPDGTMDVPINPDNVAWFKLGPHPGEKGSAVIAGHFGWKDGAAAAFDNLYKLSKGDKLYVEDGKGATISFAVRESRRYYPNADTSVVFISNDGKPHLNLITCFGSWNEASQSYSGRLVVFADME